MNKKLTDSEIKKAWECCMDEMGCTKGCPCFNPKAKGSHCTVAKKLELEKLTLDLINRKDAEIERLKPFENKIAGFNSHIRVEDMLVFANSLKEWLEFCDNLKAGAYKECIEKAKNEIDTQPHSRSLEASGERFRIHKILDNLLKELVGENGYRTFNENSCS